MANPFTDRRLKEAIQEVTEATNINPFAAKRESAVSAPESSHLSAGDVASGAAKNLIPSAVQYGKDIYQAVAHPVDTAKAVGGAIEGLHICGRPSHH